MKEVRFTIRKRAFPSQGRVRFNIAHMSDLGIHEGEYVDLINETSKKSVTTAIMADTMVREGHIRVSEEDLKTIGLNDDDEVLVRKTPPQQEKAKKGAAAANASKTAGKPDEKVKNVPVKGKNVTATAADAVKKETKKSSDSTEKAAVKPAGTGKKPGKKVAGSDEKFDDKAFVEKRFEDSAFDDAVFDDAGFDDEH